VRVSAARALRVNCLSGPPVADVRLNPRRSGVAPHHDAIRAQDAVGKELARQLALREDFDRIYLGCRNPAKAERAKSELQQVTGQSIFEVVIIDLSDMASVRAAVAAITRPLNAVVMNAGGTGGPTPASLTQDGVTEVFAGDKFNVMLAYDQVKYLAALWMASMARRHPQLRFVTMSPGNTAGTEALRDQPALLRIIANRILLPYVAPALGIGHKLDIGAKRLADAVTDTSLESGVFYASAAKTITGPVIDQAEILPQFHDARIQDHAYEAIQRFVATPAAN